MLYSLKITFQRDGHHYLINTILDPKASKKLVELLKDFHTLQRDKEKTYIKAFFSPSLSLNLIKLVKVSRKQTVTSAFIAFWWDEWYRSSASQIALPVECGRERSVIQGARHTAWARVGGHPLDAVLGLIRGQLPTQLLRQDVWLGKNTHVFAVSCRNTTT